MPLPLPTQQVAWPVEACDALRSVTPLRKHGDVAGVFGLAAKQWRPSAGRALETQGQARQATRILSR